MRDRPPLPIDEGTVTIAMVDRAMPEPADLAMATPTNPPATDAPPDEERFLRLRIRNALDSNIALFLYGQANKEWQRVLIPRVATQLLQILTKEDGRYYLVARTSDGADRHLGWFDLGKVDEDQEVLLADIYKLE